MKGLYWFIGIIILGLSLWKGIPMAVKFLSRGFRNHNPGDIEISSNEWLGKVPESQNTDGKFEQFQDYENQPADFWGLRALGIDCLTLYEQGNVSLEIFGEVFAPRSDNQGQDYGAALANQLGISNPSENYDIPSNLSAVIAGIIVCEQGLNPYDDQLIVSASSNALSAKGYQ